MHNIKYIGFSENTGYSVAAAGFLNALKDEGTDITFIPLIPGKISEGGIRLLKDDVLENQPADSVIVHTVPEYFPYWLNKSKQLNPNCKVWGYTAWETDKLPDHWPELLNIMDGILVPSTWNKQVFEQNQVNIPVKVLPHVSEFEGVATHPVQLNSSLQDALSKAQGKFVFYSISMWNDRKAPWRLIQAFAKEFNVNEDVVLIMKTDNRDWTQWKRNWLKPFTKKFGRSADAFKRLKVQGKNIYHITDNLSSAEIGFLHNACNCFVSFSRGEGWGMGAFEAAWFEKSVMMVNHGGHLDFLPAYCAYLLDYDLVNVQTAYGKKSYSSTQQWTEVKIDEARRAMRYVYENQQLAHQKAQQLKSYVTEKFNKDTIKKQLIDILDNG